MEQKNESRGRGRPRKTADDHSRIKTISITETQKAALTAYSRATGRPVSSLIDEWVREALHEASDV